MNWSSRLEIIFYRILKEFFHWVSASSVAFELSIIFHIPEFVCGLIFFFLKFLVFFLFSQCIFPNNLKICELVRIFLFNELDT